MILRTALLSFALLFLVACSSGGSGDKVTTPTPPTTPAPSQPGEEPVAPPVVVKERSLTVYVHGYSKTGHKRVGTYGAQEAIDANEEAKNIVGFSTDYRGADTNFDENIIISTSYYGNQPPDYYTAEDIQEIESAEAGIPRYAAIVAKYAKHKMVESGATKVNFLSVSMGSLVTRYLVEKNLENLSAEQLIGRWYSAEGVIVGNYAASDPVLIRLSNAIDEGSPEAKQMNYAWVNEAFGSGLVTTNPYYRDIMVGFESSTKDDDLEGILTKYLLLKGTFYPNDGYQLVKDTHFGIQIMSNSDLSPYLSANITNPNYPLTPTQSYFHENHTGLKNNIAAWSQASLFFSSKRRVQITLTHVRVDDIHEENSQIAEIVFASQVYSPQLYETANIAEAIDRRALESGILPIHPYQNNGETKILNQNLFDAFVKPDESLLILEIDAFEIDNSIKYNIKEGGTGDIEAIGKGRFDIPLSNGTYEVSGENWAGEIKVEIFNYQ